jgi:coenzyme F420-0:L-glutamate ligase/coenzyme F420-1:gamma-L-glutamate ligase
MTLTLTPLSGIPLIQPGDDLADIILKSLPTEKIDLLDGDILVLAQKIVSKAENRLVNLTTVQPSEEAMEIAKKTEKDPRFVEMVLQESKKVLRTRPGALIVEHKCGFICANAGIDHSNVKGNWGNPEDWILLLPENPDASCDRIRMGLEAKTNRRIGVMIIDSHGRPWRLGTVGVSIGVSGLPALMDLRGKPDLFGYNLRITQVGAADELAAAASLVMGQADECLPVIHARGFPYPLREGNFKELVRPEEFDMFR